MTLCPALHRAAVYAHLIHPVKIEGNAAVGKQWMAAKRRDGGLRIVRKFIRDAMFSVVHDP